MPAGCLLAPSPPVSDVALDEVRCPAQSLSCSGTEDRLHGAPQPAPDHTPTRTAQLPGHPKVPGPCGLRAIRRVGGCVVATIAGAAATDAVDAPPVRYGLRQPGGQMLCSPSSTRSSTARSGRSPPWAGRWTMTRCSSAMSPTRTRITPRADGAGPRPQRWTRCRGTGRRWRAARRSAWGRLPDREGGDQRLDLQVVVGGPGPPTGHRIGTDPSAVGSWLVVGHRHGGTSPAGPVTMPGSPAARLLWAISRWSKVAAGRGRPGARR
jgi:hypothetical protein